MNDKIKIKTKIYRKQFRRVFPSDGMIDALKRVPRHPIHRDLLLTVFPAVITSYLSTVAFVNALESVAVNMEQTVIPVIIHTTENSLPLTDFGVLSPYLDLRK